MCQRPAIGRADRELQARLHELRQIRGELGSRDDQAAESVQVIAAQRAVADGGRAAGVTVIDQYSEVLTEHRERRGDLHAIAVAEGLPRGAHAWLDEDTLLTVLARFNAPRGERAGAARRQEYLLLLAPTVLVADPHAVAEGGRIEPVAPRSIEHRVLIVHFEQHVQHPLIDAAQDAEVMTRIVTEMGPRGGRAWPVIRVAIDEWRSAERERPEVVGTRRRAWHARRGSDGCGAARLLRLYTRRAVVRGQGLAVQQIGPALERGRNGLRHGLERSLLALAQRSLHLPGVATACPGEPERSEAECEQLEAQRHGSGGLFDPAVAHAVDGLQAVECWLDALELAPDALHVRGDGVVIEHHIGRIHELLTAAHVSGMAGERMHDPELGERQQHHPVVPLHLHALGIEGERSAPQDLTRAVGGPAQRVDTAEECVHARRQVREAQVLGEEIVCSEPQTRYGIELTIACGEKYDRQLGRECPQLPAQLE